MTIAVEGPESAPPLSASYAPARGMLASWLLSTDHKRIGILYFVATTLALALGGMFALLLRIEHLSSIEVPVLAISGERDPFGTPDELRTHLAAIPGPVSTVFVPGTHTPSNNAAVAQVVRDWLTTIG